MTAEREKYMQWTDQRLERAIKKLEETIENDREDFLEALGYNADILLKLCAERTRRRQAAQPVTETPVS